ncbi:hypothetical protein [Clostridium cylindrosporum]|uniref:HTH cro/C1-type domain-containing protein n=1 Tax=Clostridium cylindrosporum DSM 605 TaxID=1121307 RepID=A0A0J8D8W6_CLOCY|nr:hypothetical protein [Clostridium cylindrosporum]KMT22317.1 hypothetical protein CLCY_17c00110 [Clostridium cylindrosporum DSM 605]
MNIGQLIDDELTKQGRIKKKIADKVGINPRSFISKTKNDTFSAEELLKLAVVLDIDLNSLKNKIAKEIEE